MKTRLIVSTEDDKGRAHVFGFETPELSIPDGHAVTNVKPNGTFRLASVLTPEQRALLHKATH